MKVTIEISEEILDKLAGMLELAMLEYTIKTMVEICED